MNGTWRFLALAFLGALMTAFGWLHLRASGELVVTHAMATEAKACNTKQDVEISHLKDTVKKVDAMQETQATQGKSIGRMEVHLEHMVKALDKLTK